MGFDAVPAAGFVSRAVDALTWIPGATGALRRTPLAGVLDLDATDELFPALERLDKVAIAAIGGPALGAACELALACDLRYIASDAGAIGSPEMSQGFAPGAGGTQRSARTIGPARALETIVEARAATPDEALALGLVHRVVAPERLLDEALATAHRLARRAPVSVAAAKRAVYEGRGRSLDSALALERRWFMAALSRPAARRALRRYDDDLRRDGRGPWEDERRSPRGATAPPSTFSPSGESPVGDHHPGGVNSPALFLASSTSSTASPVSLPPSAWTSSSPTVSEGEVSRAEPQPSHHASAALPGPTPANHAKSARLRGSRCAWQESNLRPRAPEARALSPELQARGRARSVAAWS